MDDKTTNILKRHFYRFFFPLTSTDSQDSPKEHNNLQHLKEKLKDTNKLIKKLGKELASASVGVLSYFVIIVALCNTCRTL